MQRCRDEGRNDGNHEPLMEQKLAPGQIFVRYIDQYAERRLDTAVGLNDSR